MDVFDSSQVMGPAGQSSSGLKKFSGEQKDFRPFKTDFEALCAAKDLEEVLDNPLTNAASTDLKKKYKKVYGLLILALDKENKSLCQNDTMDGNIAWKRLKEKYGGKGAAAIIDLETRLSNERMRKSEDFTFYATRMRTIFNEFRDLGRAKSEFDQVTQLIRGLRNEYNSVAAGLIKDLDSKDDIVSKAVTFQFCVDSISNFENIRLKGSNDRKENPHPQAALRTGDESNTRNRRCRNCDSTEHWTTECEKPPKDGMIVCHKCGLYGHKMRTCRTPVHKYRKTNANGAGNKNGVTLMTKNRSNKIEDAKPTHLFVLDSGSDEHITPLLNIANNVRPYSGNGITDASGNIMNVVGVGDLPIFILDAATRQHDGSPWLRFAVVKNVLLVPECPESLLSVGKLINSGWEIGPNLESLSYNYRKTVQQMKADPSFISLLVKTIGIGHKRYLPLYNKLERKPKTIQLTSASKDIWHKRLAHKGKVEDIDKHVTGIQEVRVNENDCCADSKVRKLPTTRRSSSMAENPFDLVHGDTWGPTQTKSLRENKFLIGIVDDKTRLAFVKPSKSKSGAANVDAYQSYLRSVVAPNKIGTIRTDSAQEYIAGDFENFCRTEQCKREYAVPYQHNQNGRVERFWATLIQSTRAALQSARLPKLFWDYMAEIACHVYNRTPHSALDGMTPYEALYHRKPDVSHLRVPGCKVVVKLTESEVSEKLDANGKVGIFVGYPLGTKGYLIYFPQNNKVQVRYNVIFFENIPGGEVLRRFALFRDRFEEIDEDILESDDEMEVSPPQQQLPPQQRVRFDENVQENNDNNHEEALHGIRQDNNDRDNEPILRRSSRQRQEPRQFWKASAYTTKASQIYVPETYYEAMNCQDRDLWKEAIDKEIESLAANRTWEVVEKPKDQNICGNKWVFKVKSKSDGSIDRYKARLCAQGFTQKYGADYDETYSPVASRIGLFVFLKFVVCSGFTITQIDVKNAYLYGVLEHEIFMRLPQGIDTAEEEKKYNKDRKKLCLKLRKALYGLKQSGFLWNKKIHGDLTEFGFVRTIHDRGFYILKMNDKIVALLLLWVDDGFFATNDFSIRDKFLNFLEMKYVITITYPPTQLLGIAVNVTDASISLSQSKHILELLDKFGLQEANTVTTPAVKKTNESTTNTEEVVDDNEKNSYFRSIVQSLAYVNTWTRPEISYAVNMVSRKCNEPIPQDYTAAKRILRFLKNDVDKPLFVMKESLEEMDLTAYADASWADEDKHRSTLGYIFFLGSTPVSWKTLVQKNVALSTTEAEYGAVYEAVKELCLIKKLLKEVGITPKRCLLYCDNQACIKLVKGAQLNGRTKHIKTHYHFVREIHDEEGFEIMDCSTDCMLADIMTKPLPNAPFHSFCQSIFFYDQSTRDTGRSDHGVGEKFDEKK